MAVLISFFIKPLHPAKALGRKANLVEQDSVVGQRPNHFNMENSDCAGSQSSLKTSVVTGTMAEPESYNSGLDKPERTGGDRSPSGLINVISW